MADPILFPDSNIFKSICYANSDKQVNWIRATSFTLDYVASCHAVMMRCYSSCELLHAERRTNRVPRRFSFRIDKFSNDIKDATVIKFIDNHVQWLLWPLQ